LVWAFKPTHSQRHKHRVPGEVEVLVGVHLEVVLNKIHLKLLSKEGNLGMG